MTGKTKSFSKMLKAQCPLSSFQNPPASPNNLSRAVIVRPVKCQACKHRSTTMACTTPCWGDELSLLLLGHIDVLSEKCSREGLHQPLRIEWGVNQSCPVVLSLYSQFQWGYPPPLTPYKGCPSLPFTQHIVWSLMHQAKQGDKCVVTAKIWKVRCKVWKYIVVWI